jgi:hypothetical protein
VYVLSEFDYIIEGHYNRNTIIDNNGNFEVTCVFDLDIVPLLGYTELYIASVIFIQ